MLHRIPTNGIELHVVDEGRGVPVLLLHGFPDSSHLWRHQIPALVEAGFRAIAPDLRGFGESDKPKRASDYDITKVVSDLAGVLDALDIDSAHVVGHDWGAIAAWGLAGWEPQRVQRLVAVSVGHPRSFLRATLSSPQGLKSWYALMFQVPAAPERAIRANDWWLFRRLFGGSPDFERYVEELSRPGALTAGLNWYRANGSPHRLMRWPRVEADVLGIWGSKDWALGKEQMAGSGRYVDGSWRYETLRAGHWLVLTRPDLFNRSMIDFLGPA